MVEYLYFCGHCELKKWLAQKVTLAGIKREEEMVGIPTNFFAEFYRILLNLIT